MGIRFRCEHCGDKLNVKAFLAGKRGICPKCGGKIQIPGDESEVAAGAQSERLTASVVQAESAAESAQGSTTSATARQASAPTVPMSAAGSQGGHVARPQPYSAPSGYGHTGGQGMQPSSGHAAGAPVASAAATPVARDPIDEAPRAVWYVRPASGGQFGPAAGDVMRRWMAEGRVGTDSLVWREGWPDWKQATTVFPHLGGGTGMTGGASETTGLGPSSLPSAGTSSSRSRPKKSSSGMALALVIILSLASIALLVALVFVLQYVN